TAARDVIGDRRGGRGVQLLGDLGVDIGGERRSSVTEPLGDDLDGLAGRQQHRGPAVPEGGGPDPPPGPPGRAPAGTGTNACPPPRVTPRPEPVQPGPTRPARQAAPSAIPGGPRRCPGRSPSAGRNPHSWSSPACHRPAPGGHARGRGRAQLRPTRGQRARSGAARSRRRRGTAHTAARPYERVLRLPPANRGTPRTAPRSRPSPAPGSRPSAATARRAGRSTAAGAPSGRRVYRPASPRRPGCTGARAEPGLTGRSAPRR